MSFEAFGIALYQVHPGLVEEAQWIEEHGTHRWPSPDGEPWGYEVELTGPEVRDYHDALVAWDEFLGLERIYGTAAEGFRRLSNATIQSRATVRAGENNGEVIFQDFMSEDLRWLLLMDGPSDRYKRYMFSPGG